MSDTNGYASIKRRFDAELKAGCIVGAAILAWIAVVWYVASYDDASVELKKANEKTQAYRIMLMEHKIDPETGKQWK